MIYIIYMLPKVFYYILKCIKKIYTVIITTVLQASKLRIKIREVLCIGRHFLILSAKYAVAAAFFRPMCSRPGVLSQWTSSSRPMCSRPMCSRPMCSRPMCGRPMCSRPMCSRPGVHHATRPHFHRCVVLGLCVSQYAIGTFKTPHTQR